MTTKVAVRQTGETPCEWKIRVERNRTLMQHACLLGMLVQKATNVTDKGKCPRITRIKRHSAFSQCPRTGGRVGGILSPGLPDQEKVPVSPPGVSRGIA